ncbi:MAG TPA: flagellar filament capping protein FliD, partial [Chthonomonadaceae bacterium]|nr:flagellar filament capping protein FliD [Chthonomonadaceae bacterium]
GTVQITSGGVTQSVAINLGTDSLSAIAGKINTAFGSSVATVATVTNPITNASSQQLQISGIATQTGASQTSFVDSNNVLANLGIIQQNYGAGRQLTAAQDASFTIDNLPATRSSNTFSDAISGVTITLLKDGGASTNLSVSSDTTTITSNINAFVTAYNNTIDGINNLSTYDPTTGNTGVLFGDVTMQEMENSLASSVTNQVPGLPSNFSLLSQIGITLDQGGHLNVDSTALSSALTSNLQGVAKIFQATGIPSNPLVQFVTGEATTQPSGSSGYAIQVTQPAQQAVFTAATAQTGPLAQNETLTFGGSLFGAPSTAPLTGGHQITLTAGSSLADIISQINGDPVIGAVLSASNVGGKLTLTSKQFGTNADFAVVSTIAAAGTSSGIGTTVTDQHGTNIVGTINGEAATGNGQFLTGTLQGGQANGLEVRVTATTPGSYGTISYTSGIADGLKNFLNTQTDPFSGVLTTAVNSMKDNVTSIQSDITNLETQITNDQSRLQEQFTAMETAVAQLKAAGQGLAGLGVVTSSSTGTGSSSSSSSSGSSSSGG